MDFCSGNSSIASHRTTRKARKIKIKYVFEGIEKLPRQPGLEGSESWREEVHEGT